MSSSEPLETLLAVKKAAEEAAAQALAGAIQRRTAAQEAQLRLDDDVRQAQDAVMALRRESRSIGVETASSAVTREVFRNQLAEVTAMRSARADANRAGLLAEAQAGADAALRAHQAAREARQRVEMVSERSASAHRLAAARKAEIALDEQAQATRPLHGPRNPRG